MRRERKHVFLAACGSLLLHCIFLISWALAVQRFPAPKQASATPPPIHLQIVQTEVPPPTPEPATPTPRPFLDTESRLLADKPPPDPRFESNQDTQAASKLPATGDQPLPSQEGKVMPSFAFDTTAYRPGAAPSQEAPPPAPPPRPAHTPTPAHTPMLDDEFSLSTPTPTPEDTEPPFDPSLRSPDSTMPPRPTVASRTANASNAVGFQAEQHMTSVNGNISKRGDANVDSIATPVGRYRSLVIRVIKVKWNEYFYPNADLVQIGMVKVHFVINRRGGVMLPRVVSNSSNEALATVAIRAIMDAVIPPMPPETVTQLRDGELPMDITFNAE